MTILFFYENYICLCQPYLLSNCVLDVEYNKVIKKQLYNSRILSFKYKIHHISLKYTITYKCLLVVICYYSHKNKDLIKPNKTKQARQSKQAIGGDLGFGLV